MKMTTRKLWTGDELLIVFNLYLKLPFGQMYAGNPDVVRIANLISRKPSSISFRLGNFAACDPFHQNRGIKGLPNGKRQCQPIWDEFFHNKEAVIFKSEQALAHKENRVLEAKFKQSLFDTKNLKGMSKIIAVKSRVNQYVFRQMVLANYASQCAITGIDIPELLVASHIIPWAKSEKERLNPENGICLSPMFDKAFDKGLIGIDDRYRVVFSKDLKQNSKQKYFGKHFASAEKTTISKPEKYQPKKEFLQFHMETIFRG